MFPTWDEIQGSLTHLNITSPYSGQVQTDQQTESSGLDGGKVSTSSKIQAGTGDIVAVLSGDDPTYRIWAGAADPTKAPFSVDKNGNVVANAATIKGSITLGGAANVNGTLTLLDSTGATAVLLDNTGILINNGKMTIKDSTNTAIIDATGLISIANFQSDINVYYNNQTISAGSGYTSFSLPSLTFTLSRAAKVLIIYKLSTYALLVGTETNNSWGFTVNIDGVDQTNTIFEIDITDVKMYTPSVTSSQTRTLPVSVSGITQLATGSHTIKVTGFAGTNFDTHILDTTIMYVVLGK